MILIEKKRSKKLLTGVLLQLAIIVILSGTAVSLDVPFLIADGNYTYTDSGNGTGSLTFSSVNPNWAAYTNGERGCAYPVWMMVCDNQDAIIGTEPLGSGTLEAEISFGTLTNSTANPVFFDSASLSIFEISTGNVFFSATLDGLNTASEWNHLSHIVTGSAPHSRYVTELLAIGDGNGSIAFTFTPTDGGSENFTASSSGSLGITVAAAPEPDVTITNVQCKKRRGLLVIKGTGFGDKIEGTDEYINVQVNGEMVDIISWRDNRIKASVSSCPTVMNVTVNALNGSAVSGDGTPPKP